MKQLLEKRRQEIIEEIERLTAELAILEYGLHTQKGAENKKQ